MMSIRGWTSSIRLCTIEKGICTKKTDTQIVLHWPFWSSTMLETECRPWPEVRVSHGQDTHAQLPSGCAVIYFLMRNCVTCTYTIDYIAGCLPLLSLLRWRFTHQHELNTVAMVMCSFILIVGLTCSEWNWPITGWREQQLNIVWLCKKAEIKRKEYKLKNSKIETFFTWGGLFCMILHNLSLWNC